MCWALRRTSTTATTTGSAARWRCATARVFGHVRGVNRIGSLVPRLANWVNRMALGREVLNGALGLARERSIPEFSRPLPSMWDEGDRHGGAGTPEVVLFGDCFTMYNE